MIYGLSDLTLQDLLPWHHWIEATKPGSPRSCNQARITTLLQPEPPCCAHSPHSPSPTLVLFSFGPWSQYHRERAFLCSNTDRFSSTKQPPVPTSPLHTPFHLQPLLTFLQSDVQRHCPATTSSDPWSQHHVQRLSSDCPATSDQQLRPAITC